MKHLGMKWTAAVLTTAVVLGSNAQDQLRRGFENPPESARPLVWWHWLGGNITKEGALLDAVVQRFVVDRRQRRRAVDFD